MDLSLKRRVGDVFQELFLEDKTFFNTEKVYFTPQGYISIFNGLTDDLKIKFNTNVKSIEQSEKGIKVTDEKGNVYLSKYIIVTVPLGCLKKNLIEFKPELSDRIKEAINNLEFFNMNKVFVEFEDRFWKEEEMSFNFISKEISPFYFARSFYNINRKNLFIIS